MSAEIDQSDAMALRAKLDAIIDRRIHALAPEIAREVFGAVPPGGLHPLQFTVASPTASTSARVGALPVLYRCNVESVLLVGDGGGTATVDIKRARPGETVAGESLFGANLPALSSGNVAWINPSADWVRFIEPNTVLHYYVTAVSGITTLDIALNVRCLTG